MFHHRTITSLIYSLAACATLVPAFAHAQILPDLIIELARIDASNPSLLRVKVANTGMLAATPTQISLMMEREGETSSSMVTVPMLKAGERQWIVIAMGMRPLRTDKIILHIDDPDRLYESDETNNRFLYPEQD